MNKVSISYVITFDKGLTSRITNKILVKCPKDATVISWPPSVPVKRTNLSINRLRSMIKAKTVGPANEITNATAITSENIDGRSKSLEEKSMVKILERKNPL